MSLFKFIGHSLILIISIRIVVNYCKKLTQRIKYLTTKSLQDFQVLVSL
jgi:hypothetical protein